MTPIPFLDLRAAYLELKAEIDAAVLNASVKAAALADSLDNATTLTFDLRLGQI